MTEPEPEKKKSKLSAVFRVPSTPVRKSVESASAPLQTPSRNHSAPPPPPPPSPLDSCPPPTTPLQSDSRPSPTVGKGKGKKGATAFLKGSHTQQQIWKTQENMEVLEKFLADNSVILNMHYV